MARFDGRIALVTGASGGLGGEIAKALATAAAHVLLHGRQAERLIPLERAIADAGGSSEIVLVDLCREDAATTLLTAYGTIDLLINNAGGRDRRSLAELDRNAVRNLLKKTS